MLFTDRFDAAFKLMHCLKNYTHQEGVVYAVPGGGVPIGFYLSKDYNFPMELLLIKNIRHPESSQFSIGAVSLDDYFVDKKSKVSDSYVKLQVAQIRKNLKERQKQFIDGHKESSVKNKIVFIVDDGAVTGNTLLSAIQVIRAKGPKKIVVAIPVAPEQTITMLQKYADDVICFHTLKNLTPVELNYLNYPRVSDNQISQLFKSASNSTYLA